MPGARGLDEPAAERVGVRRGQLVTDLRGQLDDRRGAQAAVEVVVQDDLGQAGDEGDEGVGAMAPVGSVASDGSLGASATEGSEGEVMALTVPGRIRAARRSGVSILVVGGHLGVLLDHVRLVGPAVAVGAREPGLVLLRVVGAVRRRP